MVPVQLLRLSINKMNMLVNVKQKLLAVFYSPRRRVVVSVFLLFCFFAGVKWIFGSAWPCHASVCVVYYMEDAM